MSGLKAMWAYQDGVGPSVGSADGEGEEEDPDRVQHVDRDRTPRKGNDDKDGEDDATEVDDESMYYGMPLPNPRCRDPDALPLGNMLEALGSWVYKSVFGMLTGNALYAVKAGVLTSCLLTRIIVRSSA